MTVHNYEIRRIFNREFQAWVWSCTCGEETSAYFGSRRAALSHYFSFHRFPDLTPPEHVIQFATDEMGLIVWSCTCGYHGNYGYQNDRRARQSATSHIISMRLKWYSQEHDRTEAEETRSRDILSMLL